MNITEEKYIGNKMETRQSYFEKMKKILDDLDIKISQLEIKMENATKDFKEKYADEINELRKLKRKAEEKLNELKDPAKEAWDELREGMDKAATELNSALKKAFTKFNK